MGIIPTLTAEGVKEHENIEKIAQF